MLWDEDSQTAFYIHRTSGVTSSSRPRVAPLPQELRMQASGQDGRRTPAPVSLCTVQQRPAGRQERHNGGLSERTMATATDDFDKQPLPEYACPPQAVSGNLRDVKEGFAISFPADTACEADPDIKDGICRGVMAVLMKAPWRPTIQLVRGHAHCLSS